MTRVTFAQAVAQRLRAQGPPIQLAPPGSAYRGGLTSPLTGGTGNFLSYLRTYKSSGTIYSIVSLLAASSSFPEWHLYKKTGQDKRRRYTTADVGSDERTEVMRHAALSLWNMPNQFMNRFEFSEGSIQHLELTGETYWAIGRENSLRLPTSMWYVRPDRMQPVPSPDNYLVGYIYNAPNGEQVPLQLDEVIQLKYPDPEDPYRGCGPVGAMMTQVDQLKYSAEWSKRFFVNSAEPGGVIEMPSKMGDDEWDEFVARWRESHQGVARANRVGVLENGAKWIANATSNKDMEFTELRLTSRDELREAWRIHKHMLGTVDDVNRANAETAEEIFGGWSVIPRLERVKMTANYKLLPMFNDDTVEFDYDNPLPDNRSEDNDELKAKSTAASILVQAGYDPDDVLEVVGLPAMDFAAPMAPTPPEPPGDTGEPEQSVEDAPEVNANDWLAEQLYNALLPSNGRAH